MGQKASLEQQAMQLTVEYQQKAAQEELMRKQFELQREQQEVQQKFQQDMIMLQQQQAQHAAQSGAMSGCLNHSQSAGGSYVPPPHWGSGPHGSYVPPPVFNAPCGACVPPQNSGPPTVVTQPQ